MRKISLRIKNACLGDYLSDTSSPVGRSSVSREIKKNSKHLAAIHLQALKTTSTTRKAYSTTHSPSNKKISTKNYEQLFRSTTPNKPLKGLPSRRRDRNKLNSSLNSSINSAEIALSLSQNLEHDDSYGTSNFRITGRNYEGTDSIPHSTMRKKTTNFFKNSLLDSPYRRKGSTPIPTSKNRNTSDHDDLLQDIRVNDVLLTSSLHSKLKRNQGSSGNQWVTANFRSSSHSTEQLQSVSSIRSLKEKKEDIIRKLTATRRQTPNLECNDALEIAGDSALFEDSNYKPATLSPSKRECLVGSIFEASCSTSQRATVRKTTKEIEVENSQDSFTSVSESVAEIRRSQHPLKTEFALSQSKIIETDRDRLPSVSHRRSNSEYSHLGYKTSLEGIKDRLPGILISPESPHKKKKTIEKKKVQFDQSVSEANDHKRSKSVVASKSGPGYNPNPKFDYQQVLSRMRHNTKMRIQDIERTLKFSIQDFQ